MSPPEAPFHAETAARRADLRARVSTAAERLAERRRIASTLATNDDLLVERIEYLGLTGDSARVLDLLPLVHVAWADGRVQTGERAAVLAILERRGLAPDTDAYVMIETLLEQKPSESFLAESLAIVKELAAKTGKDSADVVDLCARVAEASGGLFGFGDRTSDEELALIRRVADALGTTAIERFIRRFGEG